jgi:hypothetical protein
MGVLTLLQDMFLFLAIERNGITFGNIGVQDWKVSRHGKEKEEKGNLCIWF